MKLTKSFLCPLCTENHRCPYTTCHGRLMKGERANLAPKCYVPKRWDLSASIAYAGLKYAKPITPDYAYKSQIICVIFDAKGKGARKTYAGAGIYVCDFGYVTLSSCEVAIGECIAYYGAKGMNYGTPLKGPRRFMHSSHMIYPLDVPAMEKASQKQGDRGVTDPTHK